MKNLLLSLTILLGMTALCPVRSAPGGAGYTPFGAGQTLIIVRDKENGDPLIGATVQIVSGADTLRGVTSKHDMYFSVAALYSCDRVFRDSVSLSVGYLGYKEFSKRYSANEFSALIDVELEVDEQSIAQVVVTGKQIAMVFKGDTVVYNAAAFNTLSDDRLGDLLTQLPGVEIKGNKIYADGEEVKRVYVDGRSLFGKNTSVSLTDLEAADVKNVRVYEEDSPEARHTGDKSAPKEKVMDVETKSKRDVLRGGGLAASAGISFEEDYSGRREIRHSESGSFYRHSEKGSFRLEARNTKDDESRPESEAMQSKITPSKSTKGELLYEYRRGDSTTVMTSVDFRRRRNSSLNSSFTEYFPTSDYTLRTQANSTDNLSKSLEAGLMNYTSVNRGKHSINTSFTASLGDNSSERITATSQRIDAQQTTTRQNTDTEGRSISVSASAGYSYSISDKSWISVSATYNFSEGNDEGWQVDTTASTPGLRVILNNDGRNRGHSGTAGVSYRHKIGERSTISAGYNFAREYRYSRQLSIDYLDKPQGALDSVNSYDNTTNYAIHNLELNWNYMHEKIRLFGFLTGSAYQITRDERFPRQEHFPRRFLQLKPMFMLWTGNQRNDLDITLFSNPQTLSSEMLRNTLDASNPLFLRAGNPDLKMSNDIRMSVNYTRRDPEKSRTLMMVLSGNYTFNYITSRQRLFLEETYLEQYDYTAQAGSQLTTQVNVGGCYSLNGRFTYQQQIAPIRSTFATNINYGYRQTPYFLSETLYESGHHTLSAMLALNTGFSRKVRINISSLTTLTRYATQEETAEDLRENVDFRIDLRLGKYFGFVGTTYEFYCNSRSKELTRHYVLTSLAAGRKFGRKDRFSLSVGAVDIFNRPDNTSTGFETDYIRTSVAAYLGRYGYIKAAYKF